MRLHRILAAATAALLTASLLAGCAADDEGTANTGAYADKKIGFQLEAPEKGEKIAVMHTSEGDIRIRLFPDAAPKAVENFTTHAENGYYDGVKFHRIIPDFMIQGGDPEGTGSGGESIWGEDFEDEFCDKLYNFRGSLSMANTGQPGSNSSQFFINQASDGERYATLREQSKEYYEKFKNTDTYKDYDSWQDYFAMMMSNSSGATFKPESITDELIDVYAEVGGNMHLDGALRESGGHTVFGQVWEEESMAVVDAIAALGDESGTPSKDVIINSIEIVEYEG